MRFPERLKELRTEKGMSQTDLAKAIGYTQRAVSKWELGKAEPTASALVKLSDFFGESIDYLLGIEN